MHSPRLLLQGTVAALVVGCLLSAGCGRSADTGSAKGPSGTAGTGTTGKAPAGKPAFSGTAEDFAKEFAKDKDAYDKKYNDQMVELQGMVMDPKMAPTAFGMYGYEPKDGPTVLIGCYYAPASAAKVKDLAMKQEIKIRGKVAARGNPFVEIADCEILEK